jgi:hypothetical protein
MPVARFLRLLLTLVVLMSGLGSALGCGVIECHVDASGARAVPRAADVGEIATSASNALCASSHSRGALLAAFERALGDAPTDESDGDPSDEFELGDAPDFFDDDGPQGFVVVAFSGLSMPRLAALCVEPNLWGIQPSIGHPQGDDEPPRV